MSGAGMGLAWVLAAALLAQEQPSAPSPLPPASAGEPTETPPLPAPAPAPPAAQRRRARHNQEGAPYAKHRGESETPAPSNRRRRHAASEDDAPASERRANRRIKAAPPVVRPELTQFNVKSKALSAGQRLMLMGAQGGCAVLGAAGALAAAGGAALLARTVDRPAGGLWRPGIPVGGLLPLAVGAGSATAATGLCVVGLGMLGERRAAAFGAVAATMVPLLMLGVTVGLGAVFWPAVPNSRMFAIRENTMAWSIMGMAVLVPAFSLVAWHVAARIQEWQDGAAYAHEVAVALAAQDAVPPETAPAASAPAVRVDAPPAPPAAPVETPAEFPADPMTPVVPHLDADVPASPLSP